MRQDRTQPMLFLPLPPQLGTTGQPFQLAMPKPAEMHAMGEKPSPETTGSTVTIIPLVEGDDLSTGDKKS